MQKILFYSQHVLGMGHFVRAMEITRGLPDFKIRFLNGGERLQGFHYPPWVELVNLPPVKPDAELKYIESTDPSRSLDELKVARREALLAEFDQFRPDVLITELFPFGRRQFVFELLPLLARARQCKPRCKIVCSVRDILVTQPEHLHHEEWVCDLLNRYFDLVLVHSDPGFQTLQETFSRVEDIRTELRYTGYVVQPLDGQLPGTNGTNGVAHANGANGAARTNGAHGTAQTNGANGAGHTNGKHAVGHTNGVHGAVQLNGANGAFHANGTNGAEPPAEQPTIVVSVGGGRVGFDLLSAALRASAILEASQPHHLLMFAGPFLPETQYSELGRQVAGRSNVTLRRYTNQFLSQLEHADLSISMAGYNTCMNVLTTGCRALVLPFASPGNEEQTIRANKLERLGFVNVIRPSELSPDALADKIRTSLEMKPSPYWLDTRGVEKSATFIRELADGRLGGPLRSPRPVRDARSIALGPSGTELRTRLEQLEREGRKIQVFLRDDDVGQEERGLRQLLNLALVRSVPMSLQVIPGVLTESKQKLLQEYKHFFPTLLELNQHGWQHHNHEQNGRKSEFGLHRSFDQQLGDIAKGKQVLERMFPDRFHAVFTPPWNRCTEDTMLALDRLGFRVLSRSLGYAGATGHRFREIPVTLDLFRWKGGVALRTSHEIVTDLIQQLNDGVTIGIMLHHQVMDADAFALLEGLLDELTHCPAVQFHTFRSLVNSTT